MTVREEVLMAYADGELDAIAVAEVEAAIAADPALAEVVARHRALRRQLRDAFAPALDEPVPEHLLERLRNAGPADTIVFPRRPAPAAAPGRRWAWPEWGAMAAALVLGVALSTWFGRAGTAELQMSADGVLVAGGGLEAALDRKLASEPDAGRAAMGISFRDGEGAYCRSFVLRGPEAVAGLACRQGERWHIPVIGEVVADGGGELRQAAGALPAPVLQVLEARIQGEPLDAGAEREARDAGWR